MTMTSWISEQFGEDKVKWIKGIMAYFLIVVIANFVSPFTFYINSLGWSDIWVTYILIVINAGVLVAIGFVVFFLGKPIVPIVTPDIVTPDSIENTPELEPEPVVEPEGEPEPPV